ncbi:helix-hairpin-helix domain-containing protein [bacterium]|nr:helix-hairpin-helix domain-containing protein [bacterium]
MRRAIEITSARPRGVALLAVLTVLTVLSLLAGSFAVSISIDESASRQTQAELALRMLYTSGAAHVKSSLMAAALSDSGSPGDMLSQTKALQPAGKDGFGPWVYVKNENGDAIGRYRVKVEDEAAKLNINKAYLVEKSKGSGWDTGEISITEALGVSPLAAKTILSYKYGHDGVPGDRGDDDRNNALLMTDGLDNNANGIIDEYDEGVNDPGEYLASRPRGDDRAFTTLREVMPFLLESDNFKKLSEASQEYAVRELYRRATLHSVDMPGSKTLPTDAPSEINSITGAELRRRLNTMRRPVEGQSRARNQLAANMIDYRDENHVMTTLGSDIYGAEAICFNEVLANEDSMTFWVRDSSATDGLVRDWVHAKYWEDQYASKDNSRLMHCPLWYYCCITDKVINHKLFWHHSVRMNSTWKLIVSPNNTSEGHIDVHSGTFTMPDGPGEAQSSANPRFLNCDGDAWGGSNPSQSYRDTYMKLIKMMERRGKTTSGHMKFEDDMFKNMYAVFWGWRGAKQLGQFKVTSSSGHKIKINNNEVSTGKLLSSLCTENEITNGASLAVTFLAWSQGISAILPRVNWYHSVRRPEGVGRYYKVLVTNDPVDSFKGYNCRTLGVTGKASSNKLILEEEKAWEYKDGKPQKIDSTGWMDVIVKSSEKVKHESKQYQSLGYIRLIAPEVVEMYNASETAVSLANWKVVCNTGTMATEIGNIKRTTYYDKRAGGRIIDDNPAVMPRSHFYLVNDAELFDMRYGNGDQLWGSAATEEIPVFEMDSKHWGISFKLKRVDADQTDFYFYIDAGHTVLDKKLFQGESIRLVYEGEENDPRSWHGRIFPLMWWEAENGRRIRVWNEYARYTVNKPPVRNCEVMFLGLPARGGIVSLTLKNEYNQVTARTVEYGSVDVKEKGYSTEKEDPTHYKWVKRSTPTIGGTENIALNTAMRGKKDRPTWIKNGPFGSVAEMGMVRTANDFENLGTAGGEASGRQNIGNLSDYFCVGALRLNAVDGNVEMKGWDTAKYEVNRFDGSMIGAKDAQWEIDQWKGHTMRYLTGPLRGESFAIHGNSTRSLNLVTDDNKNAPRSVPKRLLNRPNKGDEFCIGPGYLTPLCYTRKANQEGEWTWHDAIPVKGTYNLYVYGLNDAISTTEFLEENYNSSLDVDLWNYTESRWDNLCKRKKYSKEDSFLAGSITPDNISDNGDIRMRLTSHDVVDNTKMVEAAKGRIPQPSRTGYAWFNYVMISPVPVVGRVNFNTASKELLAAMPGINMTLAKNIYEGLDENGKPTLKPYKQPSDIMKVKGMKLDTYKRFANLICIDSYVYTAQIEAELFEDIDHDGTYTPEIDKQTAVGLRHYILKSNPGSDIEHCVEELEEF